jgi:restriction system protein
MNRNVWLLRPKPHGTDQMDYFLENDCIAIGYPVGQSLHDCNSHEIRKLLEAHKWEGGLSNVNILVREMKPSDIVVVPYESKIYFAEVTSEYKYVVELDEDKKGSGFPHQREVKWAFNKKPISRNDLPSALRDSLQYPGAVASLTKHLDIVLDIINESEKHVQLNNDLLEAKNKAIQLLVDTINNTELEIEHRLRAVEILLKN